MAVSNPAEEEWSKIVYREENPNSIPKKYINSEDDYQEYLKTKFQWDGWTAAREVSPAGSRYRADLIVHHDNVGWLGIEAKYTRYGGAKMAEAHHQIVKKYRSKTYLAKKIDLWVYAPFFDKSSLLEQDSQPNTVDLRIDQLTCSFFNRHGIGYLPPFGNRIKYQQSDSDFFIQITRPWDDFHQANMDKINDWVKSARETYSYR